MADTNIPIATETLLSNLSTTVESVDKDSLKITVDEFAAAFAGTGEDLQRIIDSGNSFIETANANFDVTTALTPSPPGRPSGRSRRAGTSPRSS